MVYLRVISGEVRKGDIIRMMATDKTFEILETGVFSPKERPVDSLRPGEVGYITASIKNTADVKIGDTSHCISTLLQSLFRALRSSSRWFLQAFTH